MSLLDTAHEYFQNFLLNAKFALIHLRMTAFIVINTTIEL